MFSGLASGQTFLWHDTGSERSCRSARGCCRSGLSAPRPDRGLRYAAASGWPRSSPATGLGMQVAVGIAGTSRLIWWLYGVSCLLIHCGWSV
eukprot:scaffold3455_cov213-Prasinococcus_capsulatus_cf.AAC.14